MSTPQLLYRSIAVIIAQAYRAAWHRSLGMNATAFQSIYMERDQLAFENRLLRRQCKILVNRLERIEPHRRPRYTPTERLWILWSMALWQWNVDQTAQQFVLHTNTIRLWLKAIKGEDGQRLPRLRSAVA